MKKAMAECYRVLKPGRWLSLCYHDTSEGTWALIQDIMAEIGFFVDKSDSTLLLARRRSLLTKGPPTRPRNGTWC